MTEALRALLHVAFTELQAEHVYGECDQRNVASARVMEKAGMRRVAQFRRQYAAAGAVEDNYRYAIDAADWRPAAQPCQVTES